MQFLCQLAQIAFPLRKISFYYFFSENDTKYWILSKISYVLLFLRNLITMGKVKKTKPSSAINELIPHLLRAERIVVLTGAGISAESGIPTFRGKDGLWKQYRAEELATPYAFISNPRLVWEWYDWRRQLIADKQPNPAHQILAEWENIFPSLYIITQNIDGLHHLAGSRRVLELHGNIWKMRCLDEGIVIENRETPLKELPPHCPRCQGLLRPHVVWFGESLDGAVLSEAFRLCQECEVIISVGTSAVVQPAASLPVAASQNGALLVEINFEPTPLTSLAQFSFLGKAGEILPQIHEALLEARQKGISPAPPKKSKVKKRGKKK